MSDHDLVAVSFSILACFAYCATKPKTRTSARHCHCCVSTLSARLPSEMSHMERVSRTITIQATLQGSQVGLPHEDPLNTRMRAHAPYNTHVRTQPRTHSTLRSIHTIHPPLLTPAHAPYNIYSITHAPYTSIHTHYVPTIVDSRSRFSPRLCLVSGPICCPAHQLCRVAVR